MNITMAITKETHERILESKKKLCELIMKETTEICSIKHEEQPSDSDTKFYNVEFNVSESGYYDDIV